MPALGIGIGVPFGRSSGFNPRSALWPLGTEAGMWLDPSDAATGWQASDALTANVIDSPIGYRLDKRYGLALGAELVTVAADRDFSSDTGFWTKDAGVTIGSGAANFNTAGSLSLYRLAFVTTGKYYEVTFTVTSYTSGGVRAYLGTNQGPIRAAVGTYTERVAAGSINATFAFITNGASVLSIDNVSIKEVTGNHVLQATAAARPTWKLNGAIYSDLLDGTDDVIATSPFVAGTLTADMDFFCAIKRSSAAGGVLAANGVATAPFFGSYNPSAGVTTSGVGASFTNFVNGVSVPGDDRTLLNTALTVGSWVVLEIRNLNLSTMTALGLSYYGSGLFVAGDIGGVILCPAQSTANRNSIRTYLGAKVGLSL